MSDEGEGHADLVERLDRIANLMALTLVRGLERDEQLRLLAAVGYQPAEIGAFLDEKPNIISQALKRQRERSGRPRTRNTTTRSAKR